MTPENIKALKEKMKAYFDNTSVDEIIKKFEAMGYTFVVAAAPATPDALTVGFKEIEAAIIIEDLLAAIPEQTEDADWWDSDLVQAVDKAKKFIEATPVPTPPVAQTGLRWVKASLEPLQKCDNSIVFRVKGNKHIGAFTKLTVDGTDKSSFYSRLSGKNYSDMTIIEYLSESAPPDAVGNGLKQALTEIAQMSDPGSYEKAVIDMKQIACKALGKVKDNS